MKVSVITVCLNGAKTIEGTFKSIGAQSYKDVEHIVIDGASTDGTVEIISRFQNKIAKFVSESDEGIYDAMNKGLRLASGDIIGLLNADDIYADETVLERVIGKIQRNKLDAVYGDVEYFSQFDVDRAVRRFNSANFSPDAIADGWMPAHPTLFLRREVYEKFGEFRSDYRIAGDFEFISRIFRDGSLRYAYLPEVLVNMRLGGVSTRGLQSLLLHNREVLRACRENKIPTSMLRILSKYPRKVMELLPHRAVARS